MASGVDRGDLTPDERDRLAALRGADSLSALVALTGAADEHGAYLAAKPEWRRLRERELPAGAPGEYGGIPGAQVTVDGHRFHVHGVTHAGTDAERSFLRERVRRLRERGAAVYCEQGIRELYFEDFDGVCTIDDYTWAMERCRELEIESHLDAAAFEGVVEDVASVAGQFTDAVFSLVESGGEVYGDRFQRALGDVASAFLVDHEDLATGDDFESFALTERAAEDPTALDALQRYYETSFLPQPLEREWLRRHDRELEIFTHARNERMADYAVSHNDEASEVHLIVGAAHQPGVRYYLERYRDGHRDPRDVEPVG